MAALKTMTLPAPGRVVTLPRTREGETSKTLYVSLQGSPALDDSEEKHGRALPSTATLKSRHAGRRAPLPLEVDTDATEEFLWGQSSELVKKLPRGIDLTEDEADDSPSVVISNDQEIISQG